MKALALILTMLAAAAPAQQPETQPQPEPAAIRAVDHGDRIDPNELVCRREQDAGSRLRTLRRCATRAQWAEQARLDRNYSEHAQTNRTFCGGICTRHRNHGR